MHFSNVYEGGSSKAGKIALVAALHVAIGCLIVQNMNIRHISMPQLLDEVTVFVPEMPEPPPPPVDPPTPHTTPVPQPRIVAPIPDVVVEQQPVEPTVQASAEANPAPADPGPVAPPSPAAAPAAPGTGIRTAVLADANACARPDYPARSARNGDTGTVELALLVGTDGTVTSSRVQRSSGFRELDRAAQQALSLCKFKPAMEGGVPQPGWAQIAYVWTLET